MTTQNRSAGGKATLEEMLESLDKADLIPVIREEAARNPQFRDKLLLRFSDTENILGNTRRLIKRVIQSAMSNGFVGYRDAYYVNRGVQEILAGIVPEDGNTLLNLNRCFVVLSEMVDLIGSCDDSNGEIGGVIASALELVKEIILAIPPDSPDLEKYMDAIVRHAALTIYDGWTDWRFTLLQYALPLCASKQARNLLENLLVSLEEAEDSGSEYLDDYNQREINMLRFTIISRFDGEQKGWAFLEEHIEESNFRCIAVERALKDNDYVRVEKLTLDGEEHDGRYPGLVSQWRKYRLAAYKAVGNIAGQKELLLSFTLDGDFDCYLKLKSLCGAKEWARVLESLHEAHKSDHSRLYSIYTKILLEEKLYDRLMDYCEQHPREISRYYRYVVPEYPEKVSRLFQTVIRELAAASSNRGSYHEVCGYIFHYGKACGEDAAQVLIAEFRDTYRRRPAFIDELNHIGETDW